MEVDEDFDASQLLNLVREKENEDIEQLEKLQAKHDDDHVTNDDELLRNIVKKIANISSNIVIKDFAYDRQKHRWCILKFEVPVKFKNIDMTNLLRDTARAAVIWEIPKIKRAITFKQNDILCIKTEGINIEVRKKNEIFVILINNSLNYSYTGYARIR
jgi:DNA-directed RNA polymerase I subunit RPA1